MYMFLPFGKSVAWTQHFRCSTVYTERHVMSAPLLAPSAIPADTLMVGSPLNSGSAELAAMGITAYLASTSNTWTEQEFPWMAFGTWIQQNAKEKLNSLYHRMLGMYGLKYLQNGILELADMGHLLRRDEDDTYLKATDSFAALMQAYADTQTPTS